jgi:hypothetical protein
MQDIACHIKRNRRACRALRRRSWLGSLGIILLVLAVRAGAVPGLAWAAEDCAAVLSGLPRGTAIRVSRVDRTQVSGRLVGLDSLVTHIVVDPGEDPASPDLAIPLQDIETITFRTQPPLAKSWLWRLAVGGAVLGGLIGAVADPPDDTDFVSSSAAYGGWPLGFVLGAIVGTAAGVISTTSTDRTLECRRASP